MPRIKTIRYLGKQTVYNMEVERLHNYITPFGTVLHNCRYYIISRVMAAEAQRRADELTGEDEDHKEDYSTFMTGGEASNSYMSY